MATLTGQTIASSYEQILHVDTNGGGNTTTLVPVKDGDNGTTFAMQLSTTTICIDNPTADSSTQGGLLRLQSDDGAAMQSGSRLGVIEFSGAESASTITTGARIEAVTDAGWSASENGTNLNFYTTDGNASQSQQMTILADGKVGIGTASPTTLLTVGSINTLLTDDTTVVSTAGVNVHISDASNYAMGIKNAHADGDGLLIQAGDAADDFALRVEDYDSANDLLVVQGGGNVGIGTAAPDGKLHLMMTDQSMSPLSDADDFVIEHGVSCGMSILSPDANYGVIRFGSPTDNNNAAVYAAYNSGNQHMQFQVDATVIMTLLDTGLVGIGTDSPNNNLQVSGAGSAIICLEDRGAGGSNLNERIITSDGGKLKLGKQNNGGGGEEYQLSIDTNGNVGIGALVPTHMLEVTQDADAGTVVQFTNSHSSVTDGDRILKLFFSGVVNAAEGDFIIFADDNTPEMGVIKAEDAGAAIAVLTSDYRKKENVVPISKGLTEINLLKPIEFNYKPGLLGGTYTTTEGFIAHEVQDAGLGSCIFGEKDAMRIDRDKSSPTYGEEIPNYQGIGVTKLIPFMVKAIQELSAEVETLKGDA